MFCEINIDDLQKHEAVCIYVVPKSLSSAKPEAFAPQFVGLGPYHHFRSDLYDSTEELKLITAKWVLKEYFPNVASTTKDALRQLVEEFNTGGPFEVEDYYRTPIHFKGDTLKYIMAIDGLVLLDLLHSCVEEEPNRYILTGTRQLGLVNSVGVELTKDAILRDALMLENQIPLWILRKILEIKCGNPDKELLDFLHAICPFKGGNLSALKVVNYHHLLHLMYDYWVEVGPEQNDPELPSTIQGENKNKQSSADVLSFRSRNKLAKYKELLHTFYHEGCISFQNLKQANTFLPSSIKTRLQPAKITTVVELLDSTFQSTKNVHEPVTIPSVIELYDAGIKFQPAKGGISSIEFDERKGIFFLPVITLDVNTEVIIRNLVAYETLTKPKSLLFTRHVELMRAIVDTAEDVKLLVEAKIIVTSLKVGEVEKLFNGKSKSIRPTKTPELDDNIN